MLDGTDPPSTNVATLAPYRQNPNYVAALTAAGIGTVASDSSKGYPNPPNKAIVSDTDPTNFPKGASFALSATTRTVPRYPSNVYYNVASRADQLDEYNWIYTAPRAAAAAWRSRTSRPATPRRSTGSTTSAARRGSCSAISSATTRGRTTSTRPTSRSRTPQPVPATRRRGAPVGGTLYAVIDTLLARYEQIFDRGSMPLLQLSQKQVADTLAQQDAWAAAWRSGQVSAWMVDGVLHVANTGTTPVDAPLTGTTEGSVYGAQRSGWVTIPANSVRTFGTPELAKSPPRPAAGAPTGKSGDKSQARAIVAMRHEFGGHPYGPRQGDCAGAAGRAGGGDL